MKRKRWTVENSTDKNEVLALADSLNISNVLAKLLIQRGVTNFFEAKKFFRPTLDDLHDPFLMDGMEDASIRVINAITSNEKIFIYGDYDVDGTCSVALMYLFLEQLDANVEVYIPKRLDEGYGVSTQGIDVMREHGAKLIITVDCGVTAVEEVEYAKKFGIDVIICDHHQPKDEMPDAYAILDPIKPGCNYPFPFLSGAGVAFKLARAIASRIGQAEMVLEFLDLVALAAAADIVPLIDENRILVQKGIELINTRPRPGIKALIKNAKVEAGTLSAGKVVFTLAPRINAVGRMGDAMRAVQLFTAKTDTEAERLAMVLENENTERRKIDEMTFAHAVELLNETIDLDEELSIVLHEENWHPGVIGIVASRMVEKYHRPSVMLTTIDGVAKGSARSIPGFDIYSALEQCQDLLIQFGGHKAAAGLALELDKIAPFRIRFNEILKGMLERDEIIPEIKIHTKISLSEITPKFFRVLEQFAPFGPGNMKPVFLAENVHLVTHPRIVGINHFLVTLKQNGSDKVFDSIGFGLGEFVDEIDKDKHSIDIVFSIDQIIKDGKIFPQLRIKDLKVKETILT